MIVDWDDYEVYDPGVSGPLNTLSRADARRAFNKLMGGRTTRREMLRCLLRANGMDLVGSDSGIQDLNDWFVANVEADPDNPGRLLPDWYSVVNDVALFLGDVIIERCPGLRWEFYTGGKKDVSFQRHVLMGFTQVPNPKYNLDLDSAVATYGHRIVASRGSIAHQGKVKLRGVEIDVDAAVARQPAREIQPDAFWRWVKLAESQA
ncbi:MAG TPA: hypothetical protein VFW71_16435 [Actinomycetota bacterium]|nr:hypothetical protein [Actinomycetota bacterium]